MPVSTAQLKQKAQGIVTAIDNMPDNRKHSPVPAALGDDYNVLRNLTIEASPDIKPLLPPECMVETDSFGFKYRSFTFSELNIYCQQLVNLLQ
jgi:hypothetical protein